MLLDDFPVAMVTSYLTLRSLFKSQDCFCKHETCCRVNPFDKTVSRSYQKGF